MDETGQSPNHNKHIVHMETHYTHHGLLGRQCFPGLGLLSWLIGKVQHLTTVNDHI